MSKKAKIIIGVVVIVILLAILIPLWMLAWKYYLVTSLNNKVLGIKAKEGNYTLEWTNISKNTELAGITSKTYVLGNKFKIVSNADGFEYVTIDDGQKQEQYWINNEGKTYVHAKQEVGMSSVQVNLDELFGNIGFEKSNSKELWHNIWDIKYEPVKIDGQKCYKMINKKEGKDQVVLVLNAKTGEPVAMYDGQDNDFRLKWNFGATTPEDLTVDLKGYTEEAMPEGAN